MNVYLQRYGDRRSGVTAFAVLPQGMIVRFRDGEMYWYDEVRPGYTHLAHMRALAESGIGLTTYINQHVRENYARKVPAEELNGVVT